MNDYRDIITIEQGKRIGQGKSQVEINYVSQSNRTY